MAFGDTLVPVSGKTYSRLDIGSYMLDTATLDQPDVLSVANRGVVTNPSKPAQFTVKFDLSKNSGTAGFADDQISVWTSILYLPGKFSQTEIEARLALLAYFYSGAPLTKLLRGER